MNATDTEPMPSHDLAAASPAGSDVVALNDAATGRYGVRTYSGAVYFVDLDARQVVRVTQYDPGWFPAAGMSMKLVTVVDCQVGACMRLRVELAVGNMIYRNLTSTPVLRIVELAPEVEGF